MPRLFKPMPHRKPPAHATWVVVADAGRARILVAQPEDGSLLDTTDLINAEARLQDHDALSDRAGVTQSGAGVSHGFEPREPHEDHVARRFAKDLAGRLNTACGSGEVSRLYLAAAPRFLGLLRQYLEEPTRGASVKELAADLSRRSAEDIGKAFGLK